MKNKKFVLLIILVFMGIMLSGCTEVKIANLGNKGKNIICFGDSITFGYGVNPGEDYPTALSKILKVKVINAGVDGDTSAEGRKRIAKDVLLNDPYIVLIEFCGNDFIKGLPIDTTVNNMREMVRQIQDKGAIVAIVDVSAGMFLREYRLRLSKLARETGSIFVPEALNGIITNPSMKSDFMHPNVLGYKIIAQRVYQKIKPYLKEQGV